MFYEFLSDFGKKFEKVHILGKRIGQFLMNVAISNLVEIKTFE